MANADESHVQLGDLTALKSQRSTMKRNISKLKTKIEKEGSSLDYTIIKCRLQMLESYFAHVSHVQTQIERLDTTDEGRSDFEETFISAKALMIDLMEKKHRSTQDDQSFLNVTTPLYSHQNRLPQLKLPNFDGKYSEYSGGPALAVVKPYAVSEENYENALGRLKERYDNKSLIFIDHVNSLFSIAPMNRSNATELRSILDKVAALRSSLLSLGSEVDVMNAIIIHIILSKIDAASKATYDEKQQFKTLPSWDDCYNILNRRCQFLESRKKEGDCETSKLKFKQCASSFAMSQNLCEYCRSIDHYIGSCPSYLSLPISRRFDFVKSSKLCINCLRKGHIVSKCSSKSRCKNCRVSHHTTLHNDQFERVPHYNLDFPSPQHATAPAQTTNRPSSSFGHRSPTFLNQANSKDLNSASQPSASRAAIHVTTKSSPTFRTHTRCILPTALVLVRDNFGVFQPARALLDSCSEVNLITQETVHRLRLPKIDSSQDVAGISDIRTQLKQKVAATLKSRINSSEYTCTFSVTKSISSVQPSEPLDISQWTVPRGLELADPQFYLPQRVDLLLSSEVFFEFLMEGKISFGNGLPHMLNTSFGWIIGGKFDNVQQNQTAVCNVVTTVQDLDVMLKSFWELEEYSQKSPLLTEEEIQCEEHFVQHTTFDQTGRVKVRLPFKFSFTHLGKSFETARRRLLYLEKRFLKDDSLRKLYVDFMNEYIDMGHMTLVSSEVLNRPHYVIPHHPVLRPQSTTTKLRVVFDASAQTSTYTSLNKILMVGPTIQQDLITTLLSFRLHKYALSADICKMYRQFLIDERDRNFQLILWRITMTDPIDIYQLNTVTYGTSAAPFLAVRSLFFIADSYKLEFPLGSSILKQDFYVDDLLTGASTIVELIEKQSEVIKILQKSGLELSKWNSNVQQLACSRNEMEIKTNNDHITKALGMLWNPNQDLFCFRFESPALEIPTKRLVLSVVARIFDVLGLLSPIVVSCKILIQEMWKHQLDWDSPLIESLRNRWLQIERSINKIEVPRFVQTSQDTVFDIHGFADASQSAYGCCIYIRAPKGTGYQSTILIAKSKVAPVVQQPLPRLELCAALLLSRTWDKIRHKFYSYNHRTIFWSDSKIVLSWLAKHSSSFVCFVANRISEIQNLSHNIPWKHVPSKQNPADIASRGCLASELLSTIWFTGPQFLTKSEKDWPNDTSLKVELPASEMRKSSFTTTVAEKSIITQIIEKHSSYLRVLHIIVFIHRVFHKDKRSAFVTAEELQLVFWKVVHDVQSSMFGAEINLIKQGKILQPSLQNLSPFLHYMPSYKTALPIIRVGGRLANSSLLFEAKFPALLPRNHPFTILHIKYIHIKHLHAGPKALLGILRQQVWVINAGSIIRKVIRNCVHCFRYKPTLAQQVMGNLPADRLRAQRPFLVSGVDFCGPFFTSYRIRGKPPYKTYVAIFVCFASKAVHIELVSDLSTNTFILCLKRFVGRRGIPQRLYCDNATNFVGAHHKLQEFKKRFFNDENVTALMHFAEVTGFEFSFIPLRSPHFGSLWEAAVKSTKTILIKNMCRAGTTYEEFQTVLIEVEAILNSRPLAPKSDDPNDGEALTPAHFLVGSSLLALPDENLGHCKNISYLKRWQLVTYLKQQFWTKWLRDYVSALQQKAKWFQTCENAKEGTLVLIHEDNLPPQQWLLGRIHRAIPGTDGKVRGVDLKTSKGIYRRPICKIAPLPVETFN